MIDVISLCSGYGGLDDGVTAALKAHGHDPRLIAFAEFDKHAATVFEHHYPDVPNLGDVTTIDWTPYRDHPRPVAITAGYPCQPFSSAGKQLGTADPRHLWPAIAQAVRAVRPQFVFLENVARHRSHGFGEVIGDLAAAGYRVAWCSLRASSVGAAHHRERVFIAATYTEGA